MHKSACLTVFWLLTMLAVVHGQPVDGLSKRAPDDAVPGIRKNVMILFIGSAAGGFVLNVILFIIVACMANKAKANSSKSKTSSLNSQEGANNFGTVPDEPVTFVPQSERTHNTSGNNNSRAAPSNYAQSMTTYYTGSSGISGYYSLDNPSLSTHGAGDGVSLNAAGFTTPIKAYIDPVLYPASIHSTGSSSKPNITQDQYHELQDMARQLSEEERKTLPYFPKLSYLLIDPSDTFWFTTIAKYKEAINKPSN